MHSLRFSSLYEIFVKIIVLLDIFVAVTPKRNSNELLAFFSRIKNLLPGRRDIIRVRIIPVRSVQFYDQMYSVFNCA